MIPIRHEEPQESAKELESPETIEEQVRRLWQRLEHIERILFNLVEKISKDSG
jgi:hypothetical protein